MKTGKCLECNTVITGSTSNKMEIDQVRHWRATGHRRFGGGKGWGGRVYGPRPEHYAATGVAQANGHTAQPAASAVVTVTKEQVSHGVTMPQVMDAIRDQMVWAKGIPHHIATLENQVQGLTKEIAAMPKTTSTTTPAPSPPELQRISAFLDHIGKFFSEGTRVPVTVAARSHRGWTPEMRAAQSQRMRARHVARKARLTGNSTAAPQDVQGSIAVALKHGIRISETGKAAKAIGISPRALNSIINRGVEAKNIIVEKVSTGKRGNPPKQYRLVA